MVDATLTTASDQTKTSDRGAAHVLKAAASAVGYDVSGMVVSRSSIRRSRQKHRQAIAHTINASFFLTSKLVVHSDGKILPDKNQEKVDCLSVLVLQQSFWEFENFHLGLVWL